jgi:hypothetical protein
VINGTLTNTGTVAYAASALMSVGTSSTIIFNGSAAQTTGTGFPATVNNLTLNNSYSGSPDLTLSNNLTVNGTFTVTQGTLSLNGKTLSYGTSASLLYNGSAPQTSGSEWLSSMTRPVTISNTSASGVIMDGNRGSTSSITVTTGATLTMSTYVISGTGSFTLGGGATFVTANTNGVDGSITTGSYSVRTTGNYTVNGSSAQITGLNFPATVNNFSVENSAGVTWSGNITVNGNLNVNQGFFEMDDQYFQIPNNSIPIAAFVVVTSTPAYSQNISTGNGRLTEPGVQDQLAADSIGMRWTTTTMIGQVKAIFPQFTKEVQNTQQLPIVSAAASAGWIYPYLTLTTLARVLILSVAPMREPCLWSSPPLRLRLVPSTK